MQNRYIGDIGDFGKYGLLRAICRQDLTLGVVWCINPCEQPNRDGSLIAYLSDEHDKAGLRICDPTLHLTLRQIITGGNRSVAAVQQSRLFTTGTVFFEEPIPCDAGDRKAWIRDALFATRGAQVVFFDPDNGLMTSGMASRAQFPKYISSSELEPFLSRGQSIVVYQHQTRKGDLSRQIARGFDLLASSWRRHMWAVSFHRQQVRIYFIVPSASLVHVIGERLVELQMSPWRAHFRVISSRA